MAFQYNPKPYYIDERGCCIRLTPYFTIEELGDYLLLPLMNMKQLHIYLRMQHQFKNLLDWN